MSRLPNLFVVGSAKAGTTALYYYFKAHPQIYVPETIKETNYMAYFGGLPRPTGPGDIVAVSTSVTSLTEYEALYAQRNGETIAADVSPGYLFFPQSSGKIAELCPNAKIVIILRNPIESALSMFSMMYRLRREPCEPFVDAFQRSHERMAAGWAWNWNYQDYFLYSGQVARYLDLFPRSQIFIRRYEELKHTPEKFYHDLTAFLGVENLKLQEANDWVNMGARHWDRLRRTRRGKILLELARTAEKLLPPKVCKQLRIDALQQPGFHLSLEDRRMLAAHFRDDVCKLSKMLNWNLDDWLQCYHGSREAA